MTRVDVLFGRDPELVASRVSLGRNEFLLAKSTGPVSLSETGSLDERDRFELSAIRNRDAALRYATGRQLLRRTLSAFVDHSIAPSQWRFERDKSGRPYLSPADRQIAFSVTHTNTESVVAVGTAAVGIDAEDLGREISLGDISPFLSKQERRRLTALPGQPSASMLLSHWTLKEAFLKLQGTGFAVDPATCELAAHLPMHCMTMEHRSYRATGRAEAAIWRDAVGKVDSIITMVTGSPLPKRC